MSRAAVLGLGFAMGVAACGQVRDVDAGGSAPKGGWDPSRALQYFVPPAPGESLVLALDDADTTNASKLRELVTNALLAHLGTALRLDACVEQSARHEVIVVHPSGPERWTSSADDARLRLQPGAMTSDDVGAAVSELAKKRDLGAPFALIARLTAAVQLSAGLRAPSGDDETLIALPPGQPRIVRAVVASTRDDESTLPAESYIIDAGANEAVELSVTRSMVAESAGGIIPELARLDRWADANADKVALSEFSWDPNGSIKPVSAFDVTELDVTPQCPLGGVNEPGNCRLFVLRKEDACPSALGLVDPVGSGGERRPQYQLVNGARMRVCELPPLSGDALLACRGGEACDGCGIGWCTTDHASDACLCVGTPTPRLRLVGDPFGGQLGVLAVLCD